MTDITKDHVTRNDDFEDVVKIDNTLDHDNGIRLNNTIDNNQPSHKKILEESQFVFDPDDNGRSSYQS